MTTMARFTGKTALITGGASGIGKATAKLLAGGGANVLIGDIQDEAGQGVVKEITGAGGSAAYVHLDVTSEDDWNAAVAVAESTFGGLTTLVNNAGIGDTLPIEETPLKDWDKVIAVTQTSAFLGMKAASAALQASGNGSVVNISSMYGIVGGLGGPSYAAAKGAVRILTKNTALGWAKTGVRANSVHPGYINTPILGETDRQYLIDTTPMGRLGEPEEVANVIAFLASDESSFMTGSEVVVDGGYTAG
jgi:NAD(P)-dependent dehydrogenase (short-subunit alcohol dehydrogenase family)